MSMWPFLFKLGIAAVAGIGLGLVLLHQETYRRDNERRQRRDPGDNDGVRSNRKQRKNLPRSRSEEENQRELLENQLNSGTAECIICTENLFYYDKVWSCPHCWNIFHIHCISRWAETNARSHWSWSCPVCRNDINGSALSLKYKCMCGRVTEPKVVHGVTPHCCGMTCMRNCGRQCHPGPCTVSATSRKHM